jgi:ATP-dependent Lon protease
MKESAQIALSWIKSNAAVLQISKFPFETSDIHIHVPSGGISKDGPSAGITILVAILSHILKRPILQNLAMTGEITLLGEILPVGGIRDKVLAAKSMNINNLILPKSNRKDYDQLKLGDLHVTFADNVYAALKVAFGSDLHLSKL